VADTGTGIPRRIRRRIFEPFFTTRAGNGSGLGLGVCRLLVEGFHGRLTVRSQEGKGSCFTVALPASGKATAPARSAAKALARSA